MAGWQQPSWLIERIGLLGIGNDLPRDVLLDLLKSELDSGGANANNPAILVTDYGAVGDGTTDDTAAIQAALAAAEAAGADLHFPRCTNAYMIRNTIRLTKSTRVTGVEDGPIRKIAAVTSSIPGAVLQGDTTVTVADATGFVVGYDIYIGPADDTANSYSGTKAVITNINGNDITFDSYNYSGGDGLLAGYSAGEAVCSQTFPMISTDYVVSGATPHISPEVIGVHLDGNKQVGEANAYHCSLIHFDQQHVEAPQVSRCILRNSAADAISDQGDGRGVHTYNRLYDNEGHGIHFGFTCSGTVVRSNYIYNSGIDGVYYCFSADNVTCIGNFIESCPIGFHEIGGSDGETAIVGNVTLNCGVDYELITSAKNVTISGMVSYGNTDQVVSASLASGCHISGVAGDPDVGSKGIQLLRSTHITVDVNFINWGAPYCVQVVNSGGTYATGRSKYNTVLGNMEGATTASVRVRSSDLNYIAPTVSKPNGGVDILLDDQSGDFPTQTASEDNILGPGYRVAGVTLTSEVRTRDLMNQIVRTLADDATPSVGGGGTFKTGGTTTITDFDDGVVGDVITILSAHAITITDNAAIILAGGANFVMKASDTLTLQMVDDQVWNEISRSVN